MMVVVVMLLMLPLVVVVVMQMVMIRRPSTCTRFGSTWVVHCTSSCGVGNTDTRTTRSEELIVAVAVIEVVVVQR